jgi:hypothetical protein|nr:MAG TPA: hypothetical protein [Caudoviricetes sp.]
MKVLIIILGVILGLVLGFGLLGLICWGTVNGILFLLGMATTFTYFQGVILGIVIWGLKILIKGLFSIRVKLDKR